MTGSATNGLSYAECTSSWLELESDPGLFTLLVDDFGVHGIQVEEIYDLSKNLDNSTFGFIFLFKWIERRNGRRGKTSGPDSNSNYVTDPNIINNMFFAHQIVPNSCATHALLSVLLNSKTDKNFHLGELLTNFKNLSQGLSPEMKGLAIGNQPRLAQAHNSFAKPESCSKKPSSQIFSSYQTSIVSSHSTSSQNGSPQIHVTVSNEIFHFICFVPINGRLYELDGLKPYPIDHGPIEANTCNLKLIDQLLHAENLELTSTILLLYENYRTGSLNWSDKFKQIILQRLNSHGQQNHEIRFNLMAVVADKMLKFKSQLNVLEANRDFFLNILSQKNDFKSVDLKLNNLTNFEKSQKLNVDFYVDLKSHHLVDNLIEEVQKNKDMEWAVFSENLCQLIARFELCDVCKVFSVNPKEENSFCVKKSVDVCQLRELEAELESEIRSVQAKYNEEVEKRKKYSIEAFRRKHVYNEFIVSYLKALAENGKLEELVRYSVTNKNEAGNNDDNKSSFFISPNSLFLQQNSNKRLRKK